ncbi:MAG: AI-2E family transporter [Planctomycetota bacterium]|nr:AI-2E family transporter [Planctomycetota bacterium]
MTNDDSNEKTLPPPWDRIFSLATRTFVWALLIAVLYILRPFLLLVFLTFVFAYIQAHGVEGLGHRIKSRALRVVIVGLVFLGTLLATGFTLLPQVQDQAKQFLNNKDVYIADADKQLNSFLSEYPSVYTSLANQKRALQEAGASVEDAGGAEELSGEPPAQPSPTAEAGDDAVTKQLPNLHLIRDLVDNIGKSLAENPLEVGQSVLSSVSSFLLSLLFSFLIVLDLRKIKRGVKGLANTKIGFIYDEVADNIAGFGRVLGRALEAQLFIAICNTVLTAACIWVMGLPNLLVLSTIVFFCSFIPVAGTFISSTPIALLALQGGGVSAMLIVIIMIVVVHLVETYVLNPQIYGHHMHMNPVLVLIVLTIGGKLFGVWGLILGIPIVNYVFRHAIRHPAERPAET